MDILAFYGFDWIATICQFLGMFLLARKNKNGFIVFGTGNVFWVFFALMVGSVAQVLANVVVGALNIYGFVRWDGKKK